jgi:PAS domain S-box-containing protein
MSERADGWRQLFETVFRSSANPMSLLSGDRVIVRANEAKAKLLGRPLEQLEGHRLEDFVAPEHRDDAIRAWERASREGTKVLGEYDVVRSDGSRVHVQYALEPADASPEAAFIYIELPPWKEEEPGASEEPSLGADLTQREREVIHHLTMGKTGPEIAAELFVAHHTIRTHVRNAMNKTGARTRAQLVAMAMAEGLVSDA